MKNAFEHEFNLKLMKLVFFLYLDDWEKKKNRWEETFDWKGTIIAINKRALVKYCKTHFGKLRYTIEKTRI